jgi:Rieske Fe-S protein
MQNRRDFIKRSCGLCLSITGLGLVSSQLSGCAPLPIYKGEASKNIISVPIVSFNDKNKIIIVRSEQLEFDILLVKISDSNYNALQMKCTHQDNALTANPNGLTCSAHGSTFDLEGNVTKEPALSPLKKFKTEINNSFVQISINS